MCIQDVDGSLRSSFDWPARSVGKKKFRKMKILDLSSNQKLWLQGGFELCHV